MLHRSHVPESVGRTMNIAVAISLTIAISSVIPRDAWGAAVPPYLDIRVASLSEVPPFDAGDIGGRTVLIQIEMQAPPPCDAGTPGLAYGLLIDADRDAATGVPFAPLGIDARITAECDPASGAFVSALGAVTLTTDPGTGVTLLEILTTVNLLPSVDFHWLAYAQDGTILARLPDAPDFAGWAPLEIALP